MLCLYRVVECLLLKVILREEEEYVYKRHIAVTCLGKVLLEALAARTSRMDVQTDHPLLLQKGMLRLFQEKKGSGVGGLCCKAAADLTCAKACRKVLCQPLGTRASLSSCCSGQLLLNWPGEHTGAGFSFGASCPED